MRALFARLRDLARRRRLVRRFDEEIAHHVAELESEYLRAGLAPEEARAAARREFGNLVQVREEVREQSGLPRAEALAKDAGFCIRGLVRRPFFSLALIGILALGLCAATLIYSLIDSVFLQPLPVGRPDELHVAMNAQHEPSRFSHGTIRRLGALLPDVPLAGYSSPNRVTVETGKTPESASVRLVTGGFFHALDVGADAGRVLESADDVPGEPRAVAVVSQAWAARHFTRPADAVGQTVVLNRQLFRIVGVLPPEFRDLSVGGRTDLWMPSATQPILGLRGNANRYSSDDRPNNPDWSQEERVAWLELLVRIPVARASSVLPALAQAHRPEDAEQRATLQDPKDREALAHRTWQLVSSPGGYSWFRPAFRRTAVLLACIAGVMPVLAAANVSGLLLVRTLSRHRELGVRLALGSGLVRAARLPLLEAALIAGAGWIVAGLAAGALLGPLQSLIAPGFLLAPHLSASSWWLAGVLATAAALGSSLAPAIWVLRLQPLVALSGRGGAGRAPLRTGRWLVAVQLALAVVLVALADSLGSELRHTLASPTGFDRVHVLTARFKPVTGKSDREKDVGMMQRIRAAALAVPGVREVGFAGHGVLSGSTSTSGIYVRGERARVGRGHFQQDTVSEGYLQVIGLQLLRGRLFGSEDRETSVRAAVVSTAFAQRIFGPEDPVGRRFGFGPTPDEEDWTIVGVVGDARINGIREDAPAVFYTPAAQWWSPPSYLALRCEGDAALLRKAVRDAVSAAAPEVVFTNWNTLDERVTDDLSVSIAATRIASISAGAALLLAAAGVAASLGHLVALRRRDIAIRLAVGADSPRVLMDVLGQALRLGASGALAGLAVLFLLLRIPALGALLYEQPGPLPALVAAGAGLVVSVVASLGPAWRAARTDPLQLLKSE